MQWSVDVTWESRQGNPQYESNFEHVQESGLPPRSREVDELAIYTEDGRKYKIARG
jgi:hypothetical protein